MAAGDRLGSDGTAFIWAGTVTGNILQLTNDGEPLARLRDPLPGFLTAHLDENTESLLTMTGDRTIKCVPYGPPSPSSIPPLHLISKSDANFLSRSWVRYCDLASLDRAVSASSSASIGPMSPRGKSVARMTSRGSELQSLRCLGKVMMIGVGVGMGAVTRKAGWS